MKIDRLLAITILLLNRERVTARELAERFEVSVRTIYRDIDALDMAGIPIVCSQGTGGGISLMPGYKVDRQFFTGKELFSLMTTLEGITSILGDAEILGAEEKIRSLSREGGEDGPVSINLSGWENVPGIKERVSLLVKAIREERPVSFAYTNLRGEAGRRRAEPLKVSFEFANWYLMAWCRKKGDYRYFRISRMADLAREKGSFDRAERLGGCVPWEWEKTPPAEIRLLVRDREAFRGGGYLSEEELERREDGWYGVLRWPLDEWVYRYLLGLGGAAEVLGPKELREEIARRSAAAAALYAPGGGDDPEAPRKG